MFDDLIFYSTLAVSITLGCYYKTIENPDVRKNYGAGLGMIIAYLICGRYIFHTVLMVWGNVIIIKCGDRSYVHYMSLVWTWLYLLYLHINIVNARYVMLLHQTMALRLVGLAFEIHSAENPTLFTKLRRSSVWISTGDSDLESQEPSASDIVAYAFFFIGLHKGPYYKWKIFNEHLGGSFGVLGDCRFITELKLKKMMLCLVGYLMLRLKYSPNIYYEDSFYTRYDMDNRYLYNVPLLLMFFLQCQITMLLCTSVCTEAGFGVYPAKCQPLPGHGPSVQHSLLKLTENPEKALEEEYNFSMLKCFENSRVLIGPRMKDTLKNWDMPTRYWFWANIYKNLISAHRETRSLFSYLAWTIWSGPSLQKFIISATLWVYIHLESEYDKLYETSISMKASWDIGFSMMRMFCLIYLTPCFVLTDTTTLLKYYNSIFWIYHAFLLVLIVVAIAIHKSRERF